MIGVRNKKARKVFIPAGYTIIISVVISLKVMLSEDKHSLLDFLTSTPQQILKSMCAYNLFEDIQNADDKQTIL